MEDDTSSSPEENKAGTTLEQLQRRVAELEQENSRLRKGNISSPGEAGNETPTRDVRTELEYFRGPFLSLAGHELRTPLTSIKGYSQIVQRNLQKVKKGLPDSVEDLDKALRGLESILRQCDRLNGLIQELLDFARIQDNRLELFPQPGVNLVELVERVLERQKLIVNDHPLVPTLPDRAILASCDENRLELVLDNLISNAATFSEPGRPITIGLRAATDETEAAVFWVQDEGVGIAPAKQPSIFDSFFRARNNGTSKPDGLGLNLFISYAIVRQHEGRMWLESEPGKGSTFYFSLPLAP